MAQSSTQVQKRLKYEENVLQARNLQRKTDECTSAQLDHSPSLSDSERTYRRLRDMVQEAKERERMERQQRQERAGKRAKCV